MKVQAKTIETIDKSIYILLFLFVISLTNSIFLNQIGFFFPLFLILIRYVLNRENIFEKNGLETAFLLFLAAELISAIFSINQAQAFQNFFKRMVLIPIVYIFSGAVTDTEKGKLFFKVYLGAALVTMIIYIIIAYEHFVAQLYSIESKGPSPFQYVMTAGGLMSITTIFLFALLINEKVKITGRLLYLTAFLISAVGLFSSYTRAAWLGAAAGILVVILMKKKWILLLPVLLALIFVMFYFKNESKIVQYKMEEGKLTLQKSFPTSGRATQILNVNNAVIVADHQKGISLFENNLPKETLETPSPAVTVDQWKDNYYVTHLIDTRFVLFKKNDSDKFEKISEFFTPGNTMDLKVRNNILYIADLDSGITIYKDPARLALKIHYRGITRVTNFDCDSTWFVAFAPDKNLITLYEMKDGFRLAAVDSFVNKSPMGFIWVNNNRVFFQSEDEFIQFKISNAKLRKADVQKIKGIFRISFEKEKIYACTVNGTIYAAENDPNRPVTFHEIAKAGFSPTDFKKSGDEFYFSYYKRNRLTSIFDPYHESNIERLDQWRTGLKIFAEHPVFGVGDIDLNKVYSQYKDKFLKENYGHLHNNYFQFLIILGAVGFMIVAFMFGKIFLLNIKIYNAVKEVPFVSSYSLGAAAVFVGFLFSGLGEWNFGDQEIITMIWFTLGLNIAFYKAHLKTAATEK